MKKILTILGHSNDESLCAGLARAYNEGAKEAGAEASLLELGGLQFDPVLHKGYRSRQELEPDLVHAQEQIRWADHLVLVYPIWWATPPALLKGFIDRVFLPGFSYEPVEGAALPQKLLSGRSARLIVTMDSPKWYYRLFMGDAGHKMMKKGVLEFCGIKPVRITTFAPVKTATRETRELWLDEIGRLGRQVG